MTNKLDKNQLEISQTIKETLGRTPDLTPFRLITDRYSKTEVDTRLNNINVIVTFL